AGPANLVITETMARKYFGDEDPLGKTVTIADQPVTVVGILKDIPRNSHLQFDFVLPFELVAASGIAGDHWGAFNFVTYFQLNPGADPSEVATRMTDIGVKYNCPQVIDGVSFHLQALEEIHLDGRGGYRTFARIGDWKYVYGFSAIAIFVLLIACINFINLSTARSTNRAKEIGMRKTIGAGRFDLARQFLGESVLIAVISLVAAVVLAEVLMPGLNDLAQKSLSIDYSSPDFILGAFAIIIVTGLIAGLYPALYLSAFSPVAILRGITPTGARRSLFRRILVVVQFVLSIALITGTSVIYYQLNYVTTARLGFEKENVVWLPLKGQLAEKYETVKGELLQDAEIVSVTAQDYLPAINNNRTTAFDWEGRDPEHQEDMIVSEVAYDYFEALGMEMVAGRTFSKSFGTDADQAYILNEEAVRQMGIDNPVGKWFVYYDRRGSIVGVVRDAHLRSLHNIIEPQLFLVLDDPSTATMFGVMLVRINTTDPQRVIALLEKAWSDVNPMIPFEYHFLDETYDGLYRSEMRLGEILGSFTVLAIFVSCLGLFGLASFATAQRTREIGIRKVVGASVTRILFLLTREFVVLVVLASVIAAPLAWYVMSAFLESFAYRISLGPGVFVVAGLAALVIALATVSYQAARAALANPADTLRYE
ncbi:MAG: ABC transporter permease, partial [candidate division Zixibacteria bacterium]|nr:ABC transporter permease [candidate division Zixibacteria bacterium]